MLRVLLIVSVLSMAGFKAHADSSGSVSGVAGRWTGWGLWTYGGSGTNCNMTMGFSESEAEFHRLGGVFDCNIVALYSDPLNWQKFGTALVTSGKVVGKIQAGHVDFIEPVNEQTQSETIVDLEETPQGQRMNYEETWFTTDKSGARKTVYHITGKFKRAK